MPAAGEVLARFSYAMTHRSDDLSRHTLRLTLGDALVPAILLLPKDPEGRRPAALLLHGYASHKERMAYTIGRALAVRGVAALAIDLPLHGERDAPLQRESLLDPFALMSHWRLALEECAAALQWLSDHECCDESRLAIVGYSLGAYIAVAAAQNTRVRAVVLAAGGDLPLGTPLERLVRSIADPLTAVRRIAGRPLLMMHGRFDRTVRPADADRLFKAAGEPKEMRWWKSGHILPVKAVEDAASWLVQQLHSPMSARRSERRLAASD